MVSRAKARRRRRGPDIFISLSGAGKRHGNSRLRGKRESWVQAISAHPEACRRASGRTTIVVSPGSRCDKLSTDGSGEVRFANRTPTRNSRF